MRNAKRAKPFHVQLVRSGVAIALVALAVMPSATSDARERRGRFSSVDEAVAAGVIAAPVAAEVRAHRSARVMAQLDNVDVALALAAATAPTRVDGTVLRAAFDETKATVRSEVGNDLDERRDFRNLPVLAATVSSESALLDLANATGIGRVAPDRVRTASVTASLPSIGQPAAIAAGFRGDGTYVAVIDTGADLTRPAFGSCTAPGVPASTCRVAQLPADFTLGYDDGQFDDACSSMHGTNVAGIVAATAPRTKLIVADVFRPIDPNAGCGSAQGAYDSDIAAAIDYVVAQKLAGRNIVAVNMSFGGGERVTSACADDTQVAFLRSVGIIPVAAAGNNALTGVTTGTFAGDGVSSPACIAGVVPVGATDNDGVMAYFSQSAALPSMIFAPGVAITAAGITKSGTSMAAPHVAGALAIVAAAHPEWTPDQRVQALLDSSTPMPNAYVERTERRLSMAQWPALLTRPANDDRAAATPISGTSFSTDAYAATVEPGEADHGGVAPSRTVWFRLTLDRRSAVEITSASDLGVYPSAAGSSVGPCLADDSLHCRRYVGDAGDSIDVALSNPPGPLHVASGSLTIVDADPAPTTTLPPRGPVAATAGRASGSRPVAPSAVRQA